MNTRGRSVAVGAVVVGVIPIPVQEQILLGTLRVTERGLREMGVGGCGEMIRADAKK